MSDAVEKQNEAQVETEEVGEFAIVGFELADEESEQLIYYTVDYGYPSEEEAWDALESYVADGLLAPGDYAVIQICSSREPITVEEVSAPAATA